MIFIVGIWYFLIYVAILYIKPFSPDTIFIIIIFRMQGESHVEELQERIPIQIQVIQEGNNSSSKVKIIPDVTQYETVSV